MERKLKQETGFCRFCTQGRIVKVPEDREFTQEELDLIASDECECPQAEEYRSRQDKIERAELYISNLVTNDHDSIKGLLVEMVPLIMDRKMKKCTVNIDGRVSYTIYAGKDNAIVAQRSQTIVNEAEIE